MTAASTPNGDQYPRPNNAPILHRVGRFLSELILPPACLACSAPLPVRWPPHGDTATLLCGDCQALLVPIDQTRACPWCGAVPRRPPPDASTARCAECYLLPNAFSSARSAFPYLGPAGAMIRAMKYRGAPWMAIHLARLVATLPVSEWFRETAGQPDALILPVPMTVRRQLGRGYNQAAELSVALARTLGGAAGNPDTLRRLRHTAPQARTHDRAQRFENLNGCFAVADPAAVAGRPVLLVDDVMTTGATLTAAAMALRAAGASPVHFFTIARARLRDDTPDE